MCGVSESVVRKWRHGQSDPSRENLVSIAKAGNVNLLWLATGEGEITSKEESSRFDAFDDIDRSGVRLGHSEDARRARLGLDEPEAMSDFALIPFYDVEASAGHGRWVDEETQLSQMAFRKDWLREKSLNPARCALIKAKGDSMEPTLHDGDILLIDTSIDAIKDDAIYIVQADGHLTVKRIQQGWDGSIVIISDNPRYEKQTIPSAQAKALKIAGRVRWYGHEI